MGRGRQKAKQTKVARQLKYHSPGTDLDALRAELTGGGRLDPAPAVEVEETDDEDDPYADLYADGDEDEDEDQDETA